MLATLTKPSVIAVLPSKMPTVPPVMLCPVRFAVKLWIETTPLMNSCKWEKACLRNSADESAVAQHLPPNRRFGLGIRLVLRCEFGLFVWHGETRAVEVAHAPPTHAVINYSIPCLYNQYACLHYDTSSIQLVRSQE